MECSPWRSRVHQGESKGSERETYLELNEYSRVRHWMWNRREAQSENNQGMDRRHANRAEIIREGRQLPLIPMLDHDMSTTAMIHLLLACFSMHCSLIRGCFGTDSSHLG
ncbi:hypothetical protein BD311DRAFT_770170 [Dichomitus squalens]|uniref:Uncharacterized protein n=1 Tax=Dichomitus squalens TaxID=114155 RepID=A0A4Q9MA36_9APHY|nr:hypothetical protein BD311DRAFT_770170 [Dichomitus squalens]